MCIFIKQKNFNSCAGCAGTILNNIERKYLRINNKVPEVEKLENLIVDEMIDPRKLRLNSEIESVDCVLFVTLGKEKRIDEKCLIRYVESAKEIVTYGGKIFIIQEISELMDSVARKCGLKVDVKNLSWKYMKHFKPSKKNHLHYRPCDAKLYTFSVPENSI